ncbi:hypothetical protein [Chthonobacter rhizosphaerae]|uniref:hypothetical protein n=1 Tax=Chthonobacter rhizosphaerae TaxID=2735553 RepID=UPI0015EFAF1F|nr:hypothetical protein [Chthonobacter rhizosphaerae]
MRGSTVSAEARGRGPAGAMSGTPNRARSSGRPRKFHEPSRVVTITLPEATLEKLAAINEDRARAIVHAADVASTGNGQDEGVRVTKVGPGVGMLTVPHCPSLQSIPGLDLVQILPSRFLIVVTSGTNASTLELAILDGLDDLPADNIRDREILADLLKYLRTFRRSEKVSTAEVILVDIE